MTQSSVGHNIYATTYSYPTNPWSLLQSMYHSWAQRYVKIGNSWRSANPILYSQTGTCSNSIQFNIPFSTGVTNYNTDRPKRLWGPTANRYNQQIYRCAQATKCNAIQMEWSLRRGQLIKTSPTTDAKAHKTRGRPSQHGAQEPLNCTIH